MYICCMRLVRLTADLCIILLRLVCLSTSSFNIDLCHNIEMVDSNYYNKTVTTIIVYIITFTIMQTGKCLSIISPNTI